MHPTSAFIRHPHTHICPSSSLHKHKPIFPLPIHKHPYLHSHTSPPHTHTPLIFCLNLYISSHIHTYRPPTHVPTCRHMSHTYLTHIHPKHTYVRIPHPTPQMYIHLYTHTWSVMQIQLYSPPHSCTPTLMHPIYTHVHFLLLCLCIHPRTVPHITQTHSHINTYFPNASSYTLTTPSPHILCHPHACFSDLGCHSTPYLPW